MLLQNKIHSKLNPYAVQSFKLFSHYTIIHNYYRSKTINPVVKVIDFLAVLQLYSYHFTGTSVVSSDIS